MVQRNSTASNDASFPPLFPSATDHIKDKDFMKGIYNRARRTLPHGLTIEPVETHITRTGVWAQVIFPKGCVFGPYEGPGENMAEEWKDFQSSKTSEDLDNQFNERMCNWMIFINSARNRKEANLEPIIHDGEIFFRVVKPIKKLEQFLVSSDVIITGNSEYTAIQTVQTSQGDHAPGHSKEQVTTPDDNSSINKDDDLSFDLAEYLQRNQIELVEKTVNYEPRNRTEPVQYKGVCPPGKTVRGNEPYVCNQCGARFAQSNALVKHENTHLEGLGRYRCTYCEKTFVQKGSLQKHEQIHATNQKLIICRVCSIWFEEQSDLDEHFNMFHSSEVGRAFPCFLCGNGFTKLGSLRVHQKVKHPGKCQLTCRFCMNKFKSRAYLNAHEDQHLVDKPFACQICSLKFTACSKLMNHIKAAHKEAVEATAMAERESLVCYYCGFTFSVHSQFIKHVKTCKFGLPKDTTTTKPTAVTGNEHQCAQCLVYLPSRMLLEEHLTKKHSDRPFKCKECLKCFRFSCNLQRHVLSHKALPHYCNTCNTAFRDIVNFRNHQCKKAATTGKPILICPVCRRGFYGLSQHTRHVVLCRKGVFNKSMMYRMKKQPVYCQRCKRGFQDRKELFAHERGCPGPLSLKQDIAKSTNTHSPLHYGCAICRKAFPSCSLLSIHLKKLHPAENRESKVKDIKLNVCLACKRSFNCLKGLSKHVNHCPALGRALFTVNTFTCSICSKSFKTYTLLKSHRVKCKLKIRSRMHDVNQRMMQHVNKGSSTESNSTLLGEASTTQLPTNHTCNDCGKTFLKLQGLNKHKFYCRQRSAPGKLKINTHRKYNKNTGARQCSACLKVFVNRSTLIAHRMVCLVGKKKAIAEAIKAAAMKKGPRRYVCSVCGKSFPRIQGLGVHQRFCMPDITSEAAGTVTSKSTDISCRICGKTFKKIQGLATHELTCMPNIADEMYPPTDITATSTTKKKYQCKYCQAEFSKYYVLGSHVRNCPRKMLVTKKIMADAVASQNESKSMAGGDTVLVPNDPFICRKCGTSFDNEEKLVEHDYVCCPEFELQMFACDKCSLTFTKEIDLVKHQGVHDGKKPVECGVCGKTFVNSAGLGKHRKTCFSKTNFSSKTMKLKQPGKISKARLRCDDCGNSYNDVKTLRKHKKLNRCKICHNCTLCGTNFKSINTFDDHLEVCQRTRKHLCKICGRGFRTPGFLVRHTQGFHEKNSETAQKVNDKIKIKVEPNLDDTKPDVAPKTPVVASATTTICSQTDKYSCGRCYKKFPTLEEFAEHEEIEHLRKNECPLCSQRFKTERELLLHRKHHADVYTEKCKMCPMRYKFSAHLKRHFVRKHTVKGQNLTKLSKH